jgi:hypothetical protein
VTAVPGEPLTGAPVVTADATVFPAAPIPVTPSLNELFDVDGDIEIDDVDLDLIEPKSDVRWQRKRMILPLDRPLPKVTDQGSSAEWAVTPVLDTVSPAHATDTPVPAAVMPLIEDFTPFEVLDEVKPAIPETPLGVAQEVVQPLVPELTTTPSTDEAPVTAAKPRHAATVPVEAAAPIALTPESAPGATPAPTQIPVETVAQSPIPVEPILMPTPVPEPHTAAHFEQPPAAQASEAAAMPATLTPEPAVVLTTPVQEIIVATPPGALLTDTSLDIDESDDEDYYDDEEDEEREGKLSGPLFILILFLILVVQVLFIGFLFSLGILDIGAFGTMAFDPTVIW